MYIKHVMTEYPITFCLILADKFKAIDMLLVLYCSAVISRRSGSQDLGISLELYRCV